MNERAYRRQWLRLKDKYEKRGARIFRRAVRRNALQIPFDKLTPNTYKAYIVGYITDEPIKDAYRDVYTQIGLSHGRRMGADLNEEIRKEKDFTYQSFRELLMAFIQEFILNEAGEKIISVRTGLANYIIEYIGKSLEENKSWNQIVSALERHIRSRGFFRWQIERIVRTETTAAANYGTIYAGGTAGVVYDKVWISSNDARTRRRPDDKFDHVQVNGQKVPKDGFFNVQGDLIRFPGDPKGNPANTINCRCSVVLSPRRGPDGRVIRTAPPPP